MHKKVYLVISMAIGIVVFFVAYRCAWAVVEEEQIKFDVPDESVFENIRVLKNVLSYKIKPRGEYFYQDYYYDTPDYDLFKLGYSYRFRIRDYGNGTIEYGIQFKKEYDTKNNKDFKRMEIDDVMPEEIGVRILRGKWSEAISGPDDYKTMTELKTFLDKNKIKKELLSPVLYVQQKRSRFRLKADGVVYFEISLDDCIFNPINDSVKKYIHFYQLEMENKFRQGTSIEDQKRIKDLIDFFIENYPIKIEKESKYKIVITEFTKEKL